MARNFVRSSAQGINTTLPSLSSAITISCFFKNTTTPSNDNYPNRYTFVTRESGPVINYLFQSGSTKLTLTFTSSNSVFHAIDIPHTADTNWHGAAVAHAWGSSASTKAFVDGVEISLSGVPTNATQTTGTTYQRIGRRDALVGAQEAMNGDIAQLAIYDVALSTSELKSLSLGFSPKNIRPQSLQFFSPLIRELIEYKGGVAMTNTNTTVAVNPKVFL